ncbi:NAD(P)-dependent dehydrogenase (short-subunit alcohol dehydrogenase family) [Dysgonomonas alginatilytica]|uniref:NAD(P)-dependent dehydrogenase (Short-subunit alcohol dehydrogenase family) n=1 Tax=Dysgonomonas alginatilytica TaxID=1605892 RepID=A0A2V3PUJ4_9BACT|nr:SDR family oxidoreductase [Dysgonomonas alginatilytica]PXV67981.1 NAD(P)-dependent dehydrogenase (short-subunit alcohol dehydrogenase family) [Dysgonomonas alginatilytica]BAR73179.1 putative KDG reductase [uncultured bacterium]
MDQQILKGKYAIVTGGSDGIGLAIAKVFAGNGANIVLIARNEKKLEQVKQDLSVYGVGIYTFAADLGVLPSVKTISEKILRTIPKVDILINNAGIGRFIPFKETSEEALDLHINLNIRAPYFLTQYLLESLIESKGNVINISSYFSHRMLSGRDSTAYSLTKGAIDSFTKSLAFEMGKKGVRVNAIAPGSIQTPQLNLNIEKLTPHEQERFREMIQTIYPLGKIGEAEDVAQAALFLASDQAKWITGSIMSVDGGLTTN